MDVGPYSGPQCRGLHFAETQKFLHDHLDEEKIPQIKSFYLVANSKVTINELSNLTDQMNRRKWDTRISVV